MREIDLRQKAFDGVQCAGSVRNGRITTAVSVSLPLLQNGLQILPGTAYRTEKWVNTVVQSVVQTDSCTTVVVGKYTGNDS